ncbi:MAG TPA: DNA polymerase Y family protein [Candidatus Dormibacteraeota bacterium]|nr:DNA polymerase Y family protein [Candidatus Dormibacteraeota bacterium]
MAFASIHIPDFMVQAIVRSEIALRDRAVVIVDGTPPLWNVVAGNERALQAGIELGMAKSQAAQFNTVQIRHRSPAQEKVAHTALLDLGWSFSPRMEDTAPDTVVLDLAGLSALLGSDEHIAKKLAKCASDFGFVARIAVSEKIEAAILASRGFSGISFIASGEEAKRLASLPVRALLPSLEILETLERWGVDTCEKLAALPVLQLSERLGQEGVHLHKLARGDCSRSLVLAEPSLFFEEEMELEDAVEELESLSFLLGRLLDRLCERLVARSLATRVVRLQFELERSFDKDLQLFPPSNRQKSVSRQYEKLLTLPVPVRDSKLLLKLVRLRLQSDPPPAAIVKIILSAEPDKTRTVQGELFLPPSPEPEKLELTIARLGNLVGEANVGSPQLMDTHRPGEIRMKKFLQARAGSEISRKEKNKFIKKNHEESRIRKPTNGFRIFRPGLPARVEVRDGCPVRIFFRGMRGNVVTASGPWRTSGDWWQEEPWHQDEWDLEIDFAISVKRDKHISHAKQRGVYLVYYDVIHESWFFRGMYD